MIEAKLIPERDEDDTDILFACPFMFESTNQIRYKLSELLPIEREELLHYYMRNMENIYGPLEDASQKMGKLLGWTD